MRSPKKATTVVLVGAVGLASAAYGLGSQVGDGSAAAGGGSGSSAGTADRDFQRGAPPGFEDLADSLGVEADALEEALRDFHDQEAQNRQGDFAAALAGALGISADKVTEALDGLDDKRKERFAAKLAAELGVETAKVSEALDNLKAERPGDPGEFAQTLADELGVGVDKVEDALTALRPDHGARGRHHHGPPLRQLATALGVTRAELRKALREVRAGEESRWEKRQDELVTFLADRLKLSRDRVADALDELPGPGDGPGRHGRGDHGGPGGHGPGGPGPFGP